MASKRDGDNHKRVTVSSIVLLICAVVSIGGLYLATPEHFAKHWNYYGMGVVIAVSLVYLWFGNHTTDTDEVANRNPKTQEATSNVYTQSKTDTGYEGLGRGERTSLRGGVTRGQPPKQSSSSSGSSGQTGTKEQEIPQRTGSEKQKTQDASPPRAPPESPRTAALKLVGTRLSPEQAAKAAKKIVSLQPYVIGKEIATLNSIWGFFDMEVPANSSFEPSDPIIVKLKGNLNRQRLLLHPDKNGHPEAEKTFKFLEQCHQRLTGVCISRSSRRNESMHERTRREEDELRVEEARKRKEEEERKQREEKMQQEEDEKQKLREQEARRAEEEKERLEIMLRDKEARQIRFAERKKSASGQKHESSADDRNKAGKAPSGDEAVLSEASRPSSCDPSQRVGELTITLLCAKDLPPQSFLFATNAYAKLRVGIHRLYSKPLSGNSPAWMQDFQFDVHRVDTALRIEVYREAPGSSWGVNVVEDELIGSVEIPFLDLQEWSDSPPEISFGRLLENSEQPEKALSSILELKASLKWF